MAAAAQGDRRTSRWQQTAGRQQNTGIEVEAWRQGRFEWRGRALDGSLRGGGDLAATADVLGCDGRPNGGRFPADRSQSRGGGSGSRARERGKREFERDCN